MSTVISVTRAAVGGQKGLHFLPLDPEVWSDLACAKAGRELDEREWSDLVPGDAPYENICS